MRFASTSSTAREEKLVLGCGSNVVDHIYRVRGEPCLQSLSSSLANLFFQILHSGPSSWREGILFQVGDIFFNAAVGSSGHVSSLQSIQSLGEEANWRGHPQSPLLGCSGRSSGGALGSAGE